MGFDVAEYSKNRKKKTESNENKSSGFDVASYYLQKSAPSAGDDINTRLNNLLSSGNNIANKYNERYSGYNTSYRSDSSSWLSNITSEKNKFDSESYEIRKLLNQYRDYFDSDYVSNVEEALSGGSSLYQSMLKTATDENKYWSQFGSEGEYNKYEEYRKTREEMLSYDTKAGEEEVKAIKDRLSDYNSEKSELENLKKSMTYHYPGTNNEYVPARIAELEETLSGYGDIESDYASKNAYLIEAKNLQKENKLREDAQKAEDYDAMVSRGNEMGTEVELRIGGSGYKNDIVGWRNTRNPVNVNGNSPSYIDYDFANAMTEDEVNAYSYYLAKYGRDKADEYLETIRDDVNRRVASDTYEKLKDNTFAELLFAAHAGLDQSASGLKNLVNFNDDYIPVSATQYASGMIREDLSGVSGVAYDLIQTTSNMIPSILASTISNAILPGSGAAVGAVTLGGSAAGNAYQEMLNLGYDKSQARVYSTLTGISETGLQYALGGISKLGGKLTGNAIKSFSQGINSAAAKFAIEFGGEMISEGTEEFLQDVLDPFFKSIATGEEPEAVDWGQAAYSGFLGALSAGLLNSVDVTANKASELSSARRIINDGKVDSLKNVANTFSADTVAYKLAGKVNEKTGAWKISQLLHEVNANLSEQNQADIKYNLMRTGMTEADSESVSKWLAKAVNGQNFTSLQRKALDNNPIISRVFKKVIIDSNSTVNQRIKGMMDVRGEEGSVGIDYAAIAKAQKNNNLSKSATESLAINQSIQDTLNKNAKRMFKTDRQTSYDSMIDDMVSDLVKRKNTMSDSTAVKDVSEKVSDTNNTVISSTGESVTIKKIKSINKGNMELELSDGRVVSNNDIEYRSNDEALIYESVASMGYSAETANAIVNGYTALNGVSASQYVLGVNEGYNYGKIGYPMDKIDSNGFYADLTDTQKAFAYNLGRKAAYVESENAQKILNNGKEKGNRNGKVHIASSISSMTERQKASLSTIGRVVADVTHNDVYVFESVEKDGKRVFSEDIAGHKAGESAPNGFYDQKTGAIYIDLHSGNNGEGVMLWTAAHELTHFIRQWSPAKFKSLSDFLMEEYGNKGVSIQSLIQTQINKAKANGRTLTFDGAYEEVVADAMQTMFTDSNLSEKLEKMKKQDHSLWQKIKDFFADLYKRIKKAYEGLDPQTNEAKFVREMKDSIEKISDLFAEALTDAGETFRTTIANIDVNSESVSPVFSERTWTASEYVTEREKAAKEIAKAMGVSVAKAKAYIDDVNSIAKMIANDRARLDYQASSFGSAFVSNVEYGGSFDFTTLCKKRRIYTGTFSEIQKRLKDVALTPDDVLKIRNMLLDAHYEATCGLCYVEGSRANMGKFCQEFIKLYKRNNPNSWIPNMADVNTPDGVEQMRIKHPECYEQYEYFWNHYGKLSESDPALFASQQKPKLYEARKEYKGEILTHFKNDNSVLRKNLNGGIRMQSFSDFEIVHLIDTMQIIMDMSRVGLAGQAYTKVPEFAKAFGDTGLKINLSLITKGVDKDGKLIFDDREGMPHQTAFGLRDRYSKNVGTILVTFTDAQLKAAMADPRIDFIIPFHRSQWKKGQYSAMGLPKGTKDYTFMQNEKLIKQTYHDYNGRQVKDKAKNYMPNEYWDFSKSGKENAEAYLQMCADNNKRPKFYKLLDYDGNGKYSLKKDGSTDGYWKLLIDFKMYDNDGVGSPQVPVTPTFSMDDATEMLNKYEGGHSSYPVAYDVVDRFVSDYKEIHKEHNVSDLDLESELADAGIKYSERVTDKKTLDFLDGQETITTYKTMQIIDGKLYPPMASRIDGNYEDYSVLGQWERASEHPELIKGDGKFKLDKGKGNGSIEAAYNPYMHSSNLVINDQFSGAYKRTNLVTVECEVPVSEMNSGYKAQYAKDSVGWHKWHAGNVAGSIRKAKGIERQVFLSRWIKPVRIVPDAEVASMYSDLLSGTDIAIPDNVVTPSLLNELKNAGVKIVESGRIESSELKDNKKTKASPAVTDLQPLKGQGTPSAAILKQNSDDVNPHSDRDYSYDALVNKPDMVVTTVRRNVPKNRADVVAMAKKNAAKVGKFDTKTGSVSVRVDDINADVLLATDGLKHGLRRTNNPQNDANYIVTIKAGEIIKNSIKINESNPKKQSAFGAYVMIGVARNISGDVYIVRSIVNQFNNELDSMNVLYAINAKKELAALNAPRSAAKPLSVTSPTISIANLLDLVNKHFPDILPEDVLKHYGYDSRPEGDFGENILYSDRDSDGNQLSEAQQEYFKDSKVRDDDGNLLKVFHGTSKNFTIFDRTKGRSTMDIQGSFFSPWEIDAKGYGENVRAFYLNIVNPASEGVAYKALNKFKGQNNAGVKAREYLESLGYDGVNNSNEEYIAFNPNQIKSVENINPSSDPDIRYSDRDPDSIDNRTLLANALESAAKNDIEKKYISQYQEKIDTINKEQNKLTELRSKIKELSFAKGHRDADQIRKLQTEATKTANRINIFDKQLLKLEATKPLKAVLEREKDIAKKKAEKASREALAAYRERSAQTQRDLMDRYQTRIKKSKEGRDKTELRHKILKKIKELNDLLLKGDKDHHVPLSLQKSTALALQAINMDTVNAEERLAKIRDKIAKSSNPDVIAKLQKTYDRIELQGENMATKLDALDRAYNDVKNSKDPIIANVYDEGIMQAIINLKDDVGNTPLREMSLSQLESVYDMYKMVLHTIRNANKSFKAEKRETITQLGEQVMEQVRSAGGSKKFSLKNLQWIKKFAWNNLKPVYAMKVIGSETLSNLFENVRAGEDTYAVDISEARQYFLDNVKKYNYKSWDFETRYDFKSRTGKDFSLSLQEIMSLYAYSKREQAGMHLEQGGFVFEDAEIVEKVKGIPVKYDVNIADAYNISSDTLSEIIGKLTPEQIAFVTDMQKYLAEDMGAKGNEVTRQMYDIDLFKDKNYFPLKSAKQFMFEQNEVAGEVKIKNSGFTKSTVPKANNPIILKGFMDVWSEHVSDMAMYHSFVLPLEDFNRVFNYKTPSGDNVDTMSVKQSIQNAYGRQANDYIKQMLTDLNGGARSSTGADVTNKLISLFKKGATFASLSVVIQQTSAMARAMAYVDPKYFAKTTASSWNHKTHDDNWAEVKKYAPVAIIKEMGYFDTNMGKQTTDWINSLEYEGIKEKATALVKDSGYRDEVLSRAPALADELAWVHIWNAVKAEMADKNPALGVGSEDFLKACGKRFTEVVVNTQVYDSVLSRSALMRSKDTGVKMATAFMAEPTTSLNMIAYSLLSAKRSGKKGRAFARRQIGSVIASMILNSILVSVVYAARDDDDDKTYTEKYLGSLAGSLTDAVNPLSMIPFVRDIVSIVQGYDVERSDMAVISDLYNGWQSLFKDNVSAYDKVQKFAGSIANLFGIPLKNIMRDVKSLYNVAEGVISGDKTTGQGVWESVKENLPFGSDTANAESLYNAYVSGNETMIQRVKARYSDEAKAITALKGAIKSHYESGDIDNSTAERYLIEYCGMSDDDAFWQMDKWNYSAENGSSDGYSKYDDFYTAVETGKNIKSVISEYTDNGVEAKTLAAQITSHFKPIYINMTTAEKAKLKGYLLNAYALLGYDRSKKSKDIDNWAD